jgi:hypothetical protein
MACTIDESALPILGGCPGPNELVVVGNAVGGLDQNGNYTVGYARRTLGSLITCFLQNLVFVPLQFTIGQAGSPMTAGQTILIITQPNIIQDSASLILGGVVLDRNDSTQVSYTVSYNPSLNQMTITLNQAVQNDQTYVLNYAYAGS